MNTIDVSGLPEPVAQAIQRIVETMRVRATEATGKSPQSPESMTLPIWHGTVIGSLSREEICGGTI